MSNISINVELEGMEKGQVWPVLAVYLFNRSGQLLARKPIAADRARPGLGKADLAVDAKYRGGILKIGPNVKGPSELERYQVYTAKLELKESLALKIGKDIWICWQRRQYLVRGRVAKGGAKICVGTVDVYDVDIEFCILKLPPVVIEKVRDALIDVIHRPPPIDIATEWPRWDDDYCGTPPGPRPTPPHDIDIARKLDKLPAEWRFAKERYTGLPEAKARMKAYMEKMGSVEKQAFLERQAFEGIKVSQVLYSSAAQLQTTIANNFQAFRFYLCWYPWIFWLWWPFCYHYGLEKLATIPLQPDGSFSRTIPLSVCRQDVPDLWFVVRQNINGNDNVIYARYPVPCNTYYNHPSGKQVTLNVTDQDALTCDTPVPVPSGDAYVMPLGVGCDEWYSVCQAHIKAGEAKQEARGLFNGTDPYATTLGLTMQFHEDLYKNKLAMYYRWSYRKEGAADWTHIDAPVAHRYIKEESPGKYIVVSRGLGPQAIGDAKGLFAVKDPDLSWISNDRYYAIWDTSKAPDGKYELLLEMFNEAGVKIADPAASGFKYMLMTGATGSVDGQLYVEDGGIILRLHIDNRPVIADVQSVSLAGNVPPAECQFIEYTNKADDNLAVTYVAYHPTDVPYLPNGFLDHYAMVVQRGQSGTFVGSVSSTAAAPAPATAQFAVSSLLGSFEKCALLVSLHAYPRHRNGCERIRAYEDVDNAAFAIIPKA